jgi:hypothetical protein
MKYVHKVIAWQCDILCKNSLSKECTVGARLWVR